MPRERRMSMRLAVGAMISPAVYPLRDAAAALWLRSISWTARNSPSLWIGRADRIALRGSKQSADELAAAGLWLSDDLQMDHVYPWSRGGETTYENLQTLCGSCNRTKGARV